MSAFLSHLASVILNTYNFGKSVLGTLLLIACFGVSFGSVLEAGVNHAGSQEGVTQGPTDYARGRFSKVIYGCDERHAVCEEEIEEDEESDSVSSAKDLLAPTGYCNYAAGRSSSPDLATKRYLLFCRLKVDC